MAAIEAAAAKPTIGQVKRGDIVRRARWPGALLGVAAVIAFALWGVDWNTQASLGEFAVGLGTLLLAAGTFDLARQAKREVESSERPYLVASPHPEHEDEGITLVISGTGPMQFWFRLWNVGRGPAVAYIVSLQEEDGARELIAFSTPRAISVDGAADFMEEVTTHTVPLPNRFVLRIYFEDGSRRSYATTMHLHRGDDEFVLVPVSYRMRRIAHSDVVAALQRQSP